MARRSMRSALAGRGFLLFPAAAFAVHQLRYRIGYGSHADQALRAQGHGYLESLAPWVVLLLALALATFLVLVAVMALVSVQMLLLTVIGLVRTALLVAGLAVLSFGVPNLIASGFVSALAGVVIYVGALAWLRPRGLVEAWRYVRALHH